MEINLNEITVRELVEGYLDDGEGVSHPFLLKDCCSRTCQVGSIPKPIMTSGGEAHSAKK